MAEKKPQENPVLENSQSEAAEKPEKDVPKPAVKVAPLPTVPIQVPRLSIPSFTKIDPNELYRKLLPAILFVLTFVTVMTMLLIYMDTFALAAQQFRLNMTQDTELSISADSPYLVAYVRQLHLAPPPPRTPPAPNPTERVAVLDKIFGEKYNGTLIEVFPRGGRDATAQYLEAVRGWRGVAVRAAPRDFLALRGAARALHACLSASERPRVVSYEEGEGGAAFRSRVLCLPLRTVLLVAGATPPALLSLAGPTAPPALHTLAPHLPTTPIQVIDFRSTDPTTLNQTSRLLADNNYRVAATFHDGIMYALNTQ